MWLVGLLESEGREITQKYERGKGSRNNERSKEMNGE